MAESTPTAVSGLLAYHAAQIQKGNLPEPAHAFLFEIHSNGIPAYYSLALADKPAREQLAVILQAIGHLSDLAATLNADSSH